MRRRLSYAVLTCVAVCLVVVVVVVAIGRQDDATGVDRHRLPDATLGGLRPSDDAVALRDLRGPMVVNLWANWCGPCRQELPIIQAFHAKHPDLPVLGVDWQDPNTKAALALARKVGLTYPLVVDKEPVLRTRNMPTLILVDAKGHVAYRNAIPVRSVAQLEGLVRTHLKVQL